MQGPFCGLFDTLGGVGQGPRRAKLDGVAHGGGTPPFTTARDLVRSVGADCAVAIDGNAYSVPWRLIGERVRVTVGHDLIRVHHGGREVAVHAEQKGRHGRIVDDAHLAGLVGTRERSAYGVLPCAPASTPSAALLRSLAEYEAVAGGAF